MPLSKTLQEFSSNQCKSSQNTATGLMHKDAGASRNLLCGILILKNNSSTLSLGSFLSVIALLQNSFFSLLLCKEKNLVFPFARSLAHPVCLGACSTFLVSPSVRKVLCLHPRGKAAWSGTVAGIPTAPPTPGAAQGGSAGLRALSGCCISSLCRRFPGSLWSSAVCSAFYRERGNAIKQAFYGTSWQRRKLSHCQGVLFIQQFVPRKQPI